MKIKRFFSKNMRGALQQVADYFGEDAAILSNRKVNGGVEIVAALDYDERILDSHQSATQSTANSAQPRAIAETSEEASEQLRDIEDQLVDLTQDLQAAEDKPQQPKTAEHANQKLHIEWPEDPNLNAMKQELELMRSMLFEQLQTIGWNQFSQQNPLKAMIAQRLSKLGLTKSLIESLLMQMTATDNIELGWRNLLAIFSKHIPITDNQLMQKGGIYALLGPTGVGKTTSIAKIAARFVLRHGAESVVLISLDNYRISAQQQLRTYAGILNVPAVAVSQKHSLNYLLDRYANKKLILIDTPGLSTADERSMRQLDMLNQCQKPVNKLLLMAATSQAAVIHCSLQLFAFCKPHYAVISKLDEATSLGELLSLVIQAGLPLIYTTDGQKVPDDLQVARAHHLVSKAVWLADKYQKSIDEDVITREVQHAKSA